jgi:DNA anti-recombination protein RmuC
MEKNIEQIVKDVELLKQSMETINEIVKEHEYSLDSMENEIHHSMSEIKKGKEHLQIADEYSYIDYYLYSAVSIFGAGIFYLLF